MLKLFFTLLWGVRARFMIMKKTQGFTLIELLVVIAIVSLLSSVLYSGLQESRARGQDTAKVSQISEVKKALAVYTSDGRSMPGNVSDYSSGMAIEGDTAFDVPMQVLVDSGHLSAIPRSLDDDKFTYAKVSDDQAIFGVDLDSDSTSNSLPKTACAYKYHWAMSNLPTLTPPLRVTHGYSDGSACYFIDDNGTFVLESSQPNSAWCPELESEMIDINNVSFTEGPCVAGLGPFYCECIE